MATHALSALHTIACAGPIDPDVACCSRYNISINMNDAAHWQARESLTVRPKSKCQFKGFAMRATNRQATSTVKTMKELGYTCDRGVWTSSPEAVAHLAGVADGMHALLVRRADELSGCSENSCEEAEYTALVEAIEAYETMRWCGGKIPGGKG